MAKSKIVIKYEHLKEVMSKKEFMEKWCGEQNAKDLKYLMSIQVVSVCCESKID